MESCFNTDKRNLTCLRNLRRKTRRNWSEWKLKINDLYSSFRRDYFSAFALTAEIRSESRSWRDGYEKPRIGRDIEKKLDTRVSAWLLIFWSWQMSFSVPKKRVSRWRIPIIQIFLIENSKVLVFRFSARHCNAARDQGRKKISRQSQAKSIFS